VETRDLFEDSGLSVDVVSCGGTMSYNIASEVKRVTEIQAGSYIFMDTTYSEYGIDFDHALTILTRVFGRRDLTSEVLLELRVSARIGYSCRLG